MSSAGHTSLEQIKILYEDSLTDIKDLTARLEKVSLLVLESGRLAGLESKRVNVVQHVSSDAAAADRQKTFVWAAGSLAVFGMALLGAGMALGSRVGLGVGFLAAISLGIGLVGGMVLCQVLIAGEQVLPFSLGKDKEIQSKSVNDFAWTPATFMRAAQAVKPGLESRVAVACKHVLLDNKSISNAAKMEKVFPNAVERALRQFHELEGKC